MKVIYEVRRGGIKIEAIEITKRTNFFYWTLKGRRFGIDTTYEKHFNSHEEAVFYIGEYLKSREEQAVSQLNKVKEQIEKYKELYNL